MKNFIVALTRNSKDVASIGFVNEDEARAIFDGFQLEDKCEVHLIYYEREVVKVIDSRRASPYA